MIIMQNTAHGRDLETIPLYQKISKKQFNAHLLSKVALIS